VEPFGATIVRATRGETTPPFGWHAREFGRAMPSYSIEMRRRSDDDSPFGYTLRPT
jgi:hypothetical protein